MGFHYILNPPRILKEKHVYPDIGFHIDLLANGNIHNKANIQKNCLFWPSSIKWLIFVGFILEIVLSLMVVFHINVYI